MEIDLKIAINYCIANFSTEEATERIYRYIQDSLELKEKELELREILKNSK